MSLFENKDDEERFWNLMMFKFYGTDKELKEFSPVLGIIILIAIALFLIFIIF